MTIKFPLIQTVSLKRSGVKEGLPPVDALNLGTDGPHGGAYAKEYEYEGEGNTRERQIDV